MQLKYARVGRKWIRTGQIEKENNIASWHR